MRTKTVRSILSRRQAGFSLVELMIVVIIILIVSAIALPNILQYIRIYKVRGGAQQVASAIQSARARAIMRNVNRGVIFGVVDQDTYRMIIEDPPSSLADDDGDGMADENEGPLLDLPNGIVFVPAPGGTAMRFDRMGRWCQPGVPGCLAAPVIPCLPVDRCDDVVGPYVANNVTGSLIGVQDIRSGIVFQVGVSPGGRVRVKNLNDPTAER